MKCQSCQDRFEYESLFLNDLCDTCQIEFDQLTIDELKAELGYQGDLNHDDR